jgi:hypothetical protein
VHRNGRIVAGGESESLRANVAWLLRDRRSIAPSSCIWEKSDPFDSRGFGTMVRTLTSTARCTAT